MEYDDELGRDIALKVLETINAATSKHVFCTQLQLDSVMQLKRQHLRTKQSMEEFSVNYEVKFLSTEGSQWTVVLNHRKGGKERVERVISPLYSVSLGRSNEVLEFSFLERVSPREDETCAQAARVVNLIPQFCVC